MLKDEKIQEIYSKLIKMCLDLIDISKDFLGSIKRNGGNNECTMAVIFLNRQIEVFESVVMLSGRKKSNAMSVLVRAMLENMAHLYYSNIKNGYADKWAAYQYIDILRTYEFMIKHNHEVAQDKIDDLLSKLEEQCNQFVKSKFLKDVERSLQNKKLPQSYWYETSCGGGISRIIREVVKCINQVSKEQDSEHYSRHLLEFLYHELSLKAHVKTQGFAYEYIIEDGTMKPKANWIQIDIDILLMAGEYMARVVHITNDRFSGNLQEKLQEIASKINALNIEYVSYLKERGD